MRMQLGRTKFRKSCILLAKNWVKCFPAKNWIKCFTRKNWSNRWENLDRSRWLPPGDSATSDAPALGEIWLSLQLSKTLCYSTAQLERPVGICGKRNMQDKHELLRNWKRWAMMSSRTQPEWREQETCRTTASVNGFMEEDRGCYQLFTKRQQGGKMEYVEPLPLLMDPFNKTAFKLSILKLETSNSWL